MPENVSSCRTELPVDFVAVFQLSTLSKGPMGKHP